MSEPTSPAPDTPPAKRKTSLGLTLVVVGIALFLGGRVISYLSNSSSGTGSGGDTTPTVFTVEYDVGGTATAADLTLQAPNGTSQQTGAAVPASVTYTMSSGDFVYVSAQNNGGGTITCSIKLNGIVVVTNTSSGDYAIASCSGRI